MLTALTIASLLLVAPIDALTPRCGTRDATGPDDELRALFEAGTSYTDFLGDATRRTELWQGNTQKAEGIDESLVQRARAVTGTWRFLAVAVAGCSDSVSTIPYLARLVAMVDGIDMRIVDSTVGRSVMESHRTDDGRAATPTVLLLNEDYEEVGCFIERPPALRTWLLEARGTVPDDDLFEQKMEWYAEDAGSDTLEALVAVLEAAAAGSSICS